MVRCPLVDLFERAHHALVALLRGGQVQLRRHGRQKSRRRLWLGDGLFFLFDRGYLAELVPRATSAFQITLLTDCLGPAALGHAVVACALDLGRSVHVACAMDTDGVSALDLYLLEDVVQVLRPRVDNSPQLKLTFEAELVDLFEHALSIEHA